MAAPVVRCPLCERPVNRPGYPPMWDHVKAEHVSPEVSRHRPGCRPERRES